MTVWRRKHGGTFKVTATCFVSMKSLSYTVFMLLFPTDTCICFRFKSWCFNCKLLVTAGRSFRDLFSGSLSTSPKSSGCICWTWPWRFYGTCSKPGVSDLGGEVPQISDCATDGATTVCTVWITIYQSGAFVYICRYMATTHRRLQMQWKPCSADMNLWQSAAKHTYLRTWAE